MKVDRERFSWLRPFMRALVLLAILLSGLLIVYLSPLRQYLGDIREINARLSQAGMAAPLLYTLGVFVLVMFGFPRLALCPLGGMAFGFFWGLFWSQLGTLLGAYAQFLFMRWGGRDFMLRRRPAISFLTQLFEKRGIPTVILMRQVPIANILGNLVLVLMRVRHIDFLVGTAIGIIPAAVPSTLIGTGIIQESFGKSFMYITTAIILLALIWLFGGLYVQSARNKMIVSNTHDKSDEGEDNL
jgi:uncharacterized membrane protein YdjX (TVP38/TMEM64 family)